MKKVFSTLDYMMNGHVKNLLENEGIPCFTRNDHLASAAGEVPLTECWFEVWVADDSRFDEAQAILGTVLSAATISGPDWTCAGCGQENAHQFTACWRCGQDAMPAP